MVSVSRMSANCAVQTRTPEQRRTEHLTAAQQAYSAGEKFSQQPSQAKQGGGEDESGNISHFFPVCC